MFAVLCTPLITKKGKRRVDLKDSLYNLLDSYQEKNKVRESNLTPFWPAKFLSRIVRFGEKGSREISIIYHALFILLY